MHLDGEETFIDISNDLYNKAGVKSKCICCQPQDQAQLVEKLLAKDKPDFLVLTGHDSIEDNKDFKEINNYQFTADYVKAVKMARKFCPDCDQLVIFAGACKSYFEVLIDAGANFASSPARITINPNDPAAIIALIANHPVEEFFNHKHLEGIIENGLKAVGGIQTKGKLRIGGPRVNLFKV